VPWLFALFFQGKDHVSAGQAKHAGKELDSSTRQVKERVFSAIGTSSPLGTRASFFGPLLDQFNKSLEVLLGSEGFIVELFTPDGQTGFEYVMDEFVCFLGSLTLQELVEQIVRDPDGINRCRSDCIGLEILLNAFENPQI
jgi:hypothetical protein